MNPTFLFCGDSITEYGLRMNGWGHKLIDYMYPKRTPDIINRAFAGYNTQWWCQQILPTLEIRPDCYNLTIICFGTNDSVLPNNPKPYSYQHVDIHEYRKNLESIIAKIKPNSKIVLLTPPANDGEKYQKIKCGEPIRRRLDYTKLYVDVILEIGCNKNLPAVDIFTCMQTEPNWSDRFLSDGIHLTPEGNQFVFNKIIEVVPAFQMNEPDPFLYWKQLCLES